MVRLLSPLLRPTAVWRRRKWAFTTNSPPAGPGGATPLDFYIDPFYTNPTWPTTYEYLAPAYPPLDINWQRRSAFYDHNYLLQPIIRGSINSFSTYVSIFDNTTVSGNRTAYLALAAPRGADQLFLGGANIPVGLALGSITHNIFDRGQQHAAQRHQLFL